jgi:hypothetical protein
VLEEFTRLAFLPEWSRLHLHRPDDISRRFFYEYNELMTENVYDSVNLNLGCMCVCVNLLL